MEKGSQSEVSRCFYTSSGLCAAKHRERMGPAIWEFLWLISHETRYGGKVMHGKPINIHWIAEELGEHDNTAATNLARLVEQGYITQDRTGSGDAYTYRIRNSKKWSYAYTRNGTVPQKTVPGVPQKTVAPNEELQKLEQHKQVLRERNLPANITPMQLYFMDHPELLGQIKDLYAKKQGTRTARKRFAHAQGAGE